MQHDAFVAGVQHGGLTSEFEVKIFLCYLLHHIELPLTFDQLSEILLQTSLVNYFEVTNAFSELKKSGHLLINKDQTLGITEKGIRTAVEFEKSIPKSVREKCLAATREYLQRRKRMEEIEINYHSVSDGYLFHVVMKDYGSDLVDMKLFLPTREDCVNVQERMYENPTAVYKGLLAVMMGSKDGIIEYLAEQP
ncbi:MAG: DUF4364 family protein [Oscillospiraceae bacterium]